MVRICTILSIPHICLLYKDSQVMKNKKLFQEITLVYILLIISSQFQTRSLNSCT